jgi:transcriptional regulator with PAS, ATPase and Fis domain
MAIRGKEYNQTIKRLAHEQDIEPIEVIKNALYKEQSIAGAAAALGINRETIRYWLKRAGLRFEVEQIVHIVPEDKGKQ